MSNQFDLPEEKVKIELQKAERRAFLRNEFLKLKTDPFRHATGEGGTVFDPAIQRYQALQVSGYEYFKPSGKNVLYALGFMIAPMFIYGYFMQRQRNNLENQYRRGEVAYKDRLFKQM